LKDDKVLTAWNGLMMAAFSMGARILKEDVYLRAAARAADFVMTRLRRPDGRLLARYREGKTDYLAYAADYAYLIWGLIELYEAGFDPKHLLRALELNDDLLKYFWDQKKGGLFFYGLDGEPLLTRPKEHYDGAMPSDNAVAALNFLRLARLTGNTDLEDKADQTLALFAGNIQEHPTAHAFWLMGASFKLFPAREVVIASSPDSIETFEIMEHFHSQFNPNTTLILKADGDNDFLEEKAVYLHDMHRIDGQITAYICENFSCHKPLVGMNEILQATHQP